MNDHNTIYQFVRARKGQRVGVVLATKRGDGTVGIGYSLCATKRGDVFNESTAVQIAMGRAENYPYFKGQLPHSVQSTWQNIVDRACRYFKDAAPYNYPPSIN